MAKQNTFKERSVRFESALWRQIRQERLRQEQATGMKLNDTQVLASLVKEALRVREKQQ